MKIAIVKLSALGDIVHAMIVLQYIKKEIPNATIDWFVDDRFSKILENNPHINTIHALKLKNGNASFYKEYKKLKKISPYDIVIDLQGLIKSAVISRTLGKNIIGFDKNSIREPLASFFYTKSFEIPYGENIIIRNITLVCKALNLKVPNLQNKKPFLYSNSPLSFKPTLLVIVGSSWKSKIYPKEHYVSIINALHVETFISWGDKHEKQNAQFICKQTDAKILPKLNLDELKTVILNTSLVIGGDTGPTHMALALNTPSITIFGSTSSLRNTLKTDINLTIDCEKYINSNSLDKNDFCIQNIKPEKIISLSKKLLKC
ncbi:MAG: lipopolysaccharide heptosyltransferase I [Sulfurospirillum sp.]|nr:lipopolysaccharide heptosyltransferase I [Sulfurospirillum sp.]